MSISSRFSVSVMHEDKGEKVLDGYLSKRGKLNTDFKQRWFVLYSNNTLSYYQDPTATYESPLGEISLYQVNKIKEDGTNVFHLSTPKRTFILKCEAKDELEQWLKKIKLRVSPNVVCKGWLYKKGEKNKSWKERYFILCEYEMHYQVRYYEDENKKKYKGNINCDFIEDIKILPNTSIQKYGKDKVLELITEQRTYVVAGKDAKSRNMWYKSFKKVLFGEEIDRAKEQEKWKKREIEEQRNKQKIFDSLNDSFSINQSQPLSPISDDDENKRNNNISNKPLTPLSPAVTEEAPRDKIYKQPSIFVEKGTKPVKTNPYSQQRKTNPYSNERPTSPFVEKGAHTHLTKAASPTEPFIMDKLLGKQTISSIDDENESLPKQGSNGNHNMNDSMGVSSIDGSTNPFFVDHNQSMQTGINIQSSLGTVSSVNNINDNKSSISGSNGHGHHPIQTSMTPSNATEYTQDSMISNVSGSNGGHHQIRDSSVMTGGRDTTKDSAIFSKKFLEAEYEQPQYGLLENDIEIVHVEPQKKCCDKCIIL